MSSDDAKSQGTEKKRKRVREPRVIGHVTERTREPRPDDPMFGRVFFGFLSDPPAGVEVDDHDRSDPQED